MSIEVAFWSQVDIRGLDECWEWQGTRSAGYGQFNWDGQQFVAHRMAKVLVRRPIPRGLLGCHRCDNKACNNPNHIYAGTGSDNALDRVRARKALA